jgi:nitrogenase iron protein NifH
MSGRVIPTVLDSIKAKREDLRLEHIVHQGFAGVLCVEAGGPTPGVGCAGRGIISAFEKLEELKAFEVHRPDVVIYDVLGDVVCGGFAMPLRGGYAEEVYIVTSGEMMSLYAAANISHAVRQFSVRGYAKLSGLVLNAKGVEDETALVDKAAREIGTEIVHYIPRHPLVQKAENVGRTVLEAFPDSDVSGVYKALSAKVVRPTVTAEAI